MSILDKDYFDSVPIYKGGLTSIRWAELFLNDQLFGFSTRSRNEAGKIVKKLDNPNFIGNRFRAAQKRNVEKLRKVNKDFTSEKTFDIPVIGPEDFNHKFFSEWKREVNAPIVIRGFLSDAPIMELTTGDNFVENFGDATIQCADFTVDKTTSGIGQNLSLTQATLREFLTLDKYKSYYINNFHGLINDYDFYRLCKGSQFRKIQKAINLLNQWFIKRGKHSRSSLHCANGENLFLNIQGQKEWHFIHPSYAPLLQTTVSKFGVYAISEAADYAELNDFYSVMNEKYDYFKHIPVFKITLEPGDVLYNPPWWWHDVRNLSEFTVGCATRWVSSKKFQSNFISNQPYLFAAQMVELLKAPGKSPYLSIRKPNDDKSKFINSIFSDKWEEKKSEEVEEVQ